MHLPGRISSCTLVTDWNASWTGIHEPSRVSDTLLVAVTDEVADSRCLSLIDELLVPANGPSVCSSEAVFISDKGVRIECCSHWMVMLTGVLGGT